MKKISAQETTGPLAINEWGRTSFYLAFRSWVQINGNN